MRAPRLLVLRNMRTPLLAGFLALVVPACLSGELSDLGGDDDGMDPGMGSGGGGGGGGGGAEPRLDVSIDKPTIDTELKSSTPIAVNLAAGGSFSGAVELTARAVDENDAPIAGWTVTLSSPSVTLAEGATQTVTATLAISSDAPARTGTVKIDVASSLGTQTLTSEVTAANQVTFVLRVDEATNRCVFPADAGNQANPVRVPIGAKIRWYNEGTTNLVIHTNGQNGVSHQGQAPNGQADPTTEPNTAYEQTLGGTIGTSVTWYCHTPETNIGQMNPRIQPVNP